MIVKMIHCCIRTRLGIYGQKAPSPSGKGVYLTVYPSSRPNTDTVNSLSSKKYYSQKVGGKLHKGEYKFHLLAYRSSVLCEFVPQPLNLLG